MKWDDLFNPPKVVPRGTRRVTFVIAEDKLDEEERLKHLREIRMRSYAKNREKVLKKQRDMRRARKKMK